MESVRGGGSDKKKTKNKKQTNKKQQKKKKKETNTLLQRPVQWNQALLDYNDISFRDIKFVK